ncbi:hypothetical protein [Enterocloster sp.]|uniref:hypothetical protein n=1 Tax=Enterocloster sp. TaxID=2719315 RepID=UPI0039A002E7
MGNRIVLSVPFEREKPGMKSGREIITRTRNMIYRKLALTCSFGEAWHGDSCGGGYGFLQGGVKGLESDSHVVHITDIPAIAIMTGVSLKLENQCFQRGAKADKEGAAACATSSLTGC